MSDAETRQDWQKVFLTRINGPATCPDLEIMTLAGSSQPDPRTSLEALRTIILDPKQDRLEGIEVVACSEVMLGDAEVKRALGEAIADGAFRSKLPWLESEFDKYTTEIYYRYDIPIQNSPISGETLAKLVEAASGSVAVFAATFGAPTLGNVLVYFAFLGGSIVAIGAATALTLLLLHKIDKLL